MLTVTLSEEDLYDLWAEANNRLLIDKLGEGDVYIDIYTTVRRERFFGPKRAYTTFEIRK